MALKCLNWAWVFMTHSPGQSIEQAVLWAFELGYRLIDTATIYKNEREVGNAMRDSGLDRKEIFLTTKVWNDDQGYDATLQAFEESLRKLNTDYVDLYLIHWPALPKTRWIICRSWV